MIRHCPRWMIVMGSLILTSIIFSADAQDENSFLEETLMTNYVEQADQEIDPYEMAVQRDKTKPVNLNDATLDDLQRIPTLTPTQSNHLAEYLKSYGELYSFYELMAIEGFDSITINRLKEYAIIGPPPDPLPLTPKNLLKHGYHDLIIRYREVFPLPSGYSHSDSASIATNKSYLGSPIGLTFRYRYTFSNKVIIGLTGEKDPGEEIFGESQAAGFDFYSGYLSIGHWKWLEQLTIGTFRTSFGQGLTLGGQTFGSSIGFGSAFAYFNGFRPTQSACEYGYFRGFSATVRVGRWTGSGFLSYVNRDATITSSDTSQEEILRFSSLSESGYHRTLSESAKKGKIGELVYGGNIHFRGNRFLVGLTGYRGRWYGIMEPLDQVYQLFKLTDAQFGALGIDGRVRIGWCQLFGEYSISCNGGQAWLAGLSAVPVSGVDLFLALRDYHRDYQNPFSTALSHQADNQNEQGINLRVLLQLIRGISIHWYIDLFKHPWVSYQVAGPHEGIETGLLATYALSPVWSIGCRYYLKKRKLNGEVNEPAIPILVSNTLHDLQIRLQADPLSQVRLKSSFCYRHARTEYGKGEPGYLLSQEGRYMSRRGNLSVSVKYMLFDCPYFASRIYSWEPDVLYGFSVPSCYGKGSRVVLLIKKNIGRHTELWGWGGLWKYADRTMIGDGLESIDGDLKTEIRFQVRVSF